MMQPDKDNLNIPSTNRIVNSFTYDVKRDVYNEETFQQEHRRKTTIGNMDIDITTLRHHIQCRCSWQKFQKWIITIFPFLEWMCLYKFKDWLLGDLVAGISVGIVQIPQGLTFSLMARQLIPPLNISYAAFCSSVIYVLFGSCHQMSIGFFFLSSALMVNILNLYPFNNGHLILGTFIKNDFSDPSYYVAYNKSLSVVATTTFLTGIIQQYHRTRGAQFPPPEFHTPSPPLEALPLFIPLGARTQDHYGVQKLSMGFLGFGFVATYLPEAVINAYLAATALHVIMSQLTGIFGVMISFHAGPVSFFYNMVNYCLGLPKANSTSILLFLTAVVALRVNKCIRISFNEYPIEFPMEVFLILGFTLFANKINMATESSRTIIDMIPYSYLLPVTPDFEILPQVVLQAISLALVSSSLLIFLGKKISSYHNYSVNSNQDLIVIGLCNVVSSFFRSCVFTGSVVRTIIQDKSGGRQQFASLIGAGLMLLLMVKIRRFFYDLPNAVLAGIIMSNLLPYFETIFYLPTLWRQNQYDFVIWIVTLLAALVLGLDLGLLVSIVFAFFMVTVQSHRTKIFLLGQIPNTNIYRSITDYREIRSIPGVKLIQCCNSITFVNVHQLKKVLLKEMEMVKIPLKEEEILALFSQSENDSEPGKICRCFCNCDELEPPPRIVYTERFENQQSQDSHSNLVRCSHVESETSQYETEDQLPNTMSSTSQRNQGQNYEEMRASLPSISSRKNSVPLPDSGNSQMKSRSVGPYSEGSLPASIHTIILDFSMVHFVDSQASVILRQMFNAFQNINILVLIAGCHSSVVKSLERNDFFDAGITKSQMFLTLHDAVLFALSRKFRNYSELSLDENETVIQETYSETEKIDDLGYKQSNSFTEVSKGLTQGFTFGEAIAEESSDLDTEMEDMLESPEEVTPRQGGQMEPDSEQEPEVEVEPDFEIDFESNFEREPKPNPKTRVYTLPRQQRQYHYLSMPPKAPNYPVSKRWSKEKRRQHVKSHAPKGNYIEHPLDRNYE
ncbi:testis anion transporter 1 isoform X2 [Erinaceus europaeus]|nr:testis anion transporter 1 isoform X2 [Erinaceus europaeus]XP_060045680.1 testis anion transporter 1 isoform X2 [Erinaceus europaeus]